MDLHRCGNTGWGFDTELVWSSTTAQVIDSGTAQGVKALCGRFINNSVCTSNNSGQNEVTALKTDLHAVRCCSDIDRYSDSWRKNKVSCPWSESKLFPKSGGYACFSSVTFDTAVAICAADNARLCTENEVNSYCTSGTGCGYNNVLIWTSTVVVGWLIIFNIEFHRNCVWRFVGGNKCCYFNLFKSSLIFHLYSPYRNRMVTR